MNDCIFCRIGAGDVQVTPIYQDDLVIAFDDMTPQTPVHTLVIPRKHYGTLADVDDPAVLAALFSAVPRVARAKGIDQSGYRVIVNNGPDANQTVQHLHVHVMGGRPLAHSMVVFSEDE